ncbi:MAG: AAA family ATPase [Gammaproteobacteria bacterium]
MPKLPLLTNYVLTEELGESLQAQVYKGYHKHVPEYPLVIKCLKLISRWDEQSLHIRQKIERLKVLHDPRVCPPLALECDDNHYFIVQTWFNGLSLDRWRDQQRTVSLADFFTLACSMAEILQTVHEAGIIHAGVKPHNILVHPTTLTLRLTDFITPLDIRDVSHFIYDPEFVRNTLAYTSPEQTGRINYRVDFSTDLYSLGIIFFELLTNELPFFSRDPLELIHSHLAEEADKVSDLNPDIPSALTEIIAKLTSKQPEKRYQSANGLVADLIRCKQEYRSSGQVSHFPIGRHDRSRRVIFISKMVDRIDEAKLVHREYQLVMQGRFRSLFISGLSGIGKTRLIQELQKPLVKNRGYFTSGKFDQYQKNIPYSSLIQALRNLVRTFLTESDEQVARWRDKILEAVGNNGGVIIDVVPELEFIIGPQPEPPHLPPVESRNRFNNQFGRFLACLASEYNPLVLFIDDLQWCDIATFDFLQNLFANHNEHPYLFFLGAYRYNEVDCAHPLSRLIRSIQDSGGPLAQIRLDALIESDCHEMVAYILDSSLDTTKHLSRFIMHLTEGNPLFVSESLAWLYNEGLLGTDAKQNWTWNMARIRDTQMPANVVELFSTKVSKLPPNTLHILNYCACMGNRFSVNDVTLVMDMRIEQLFDDLKPVLSLGLLLENKSELQFVHDRVQEAVLRQISPQDRPLIHWRIGNRLLGAFPQNPDWETLDNLFTIATHLDQGCPEQPDIETRYWLAEINFHAGNKALASLASEAANEFFLRAHHYLPEESWENAYDLSFRIYQRLAKTSLMCGEYENSERLLNHLIEHAVSDLDKAEALAEQTTSLSSFGNFNKAIETANRGLAYFDKSIPDDAEQAARRMERLMPEISRQGDVWAKILNMPFTHERRRKIELAFYSELIPDLYMCGMVPQLYLSAAQSTLHCLEGGMDESVIYSFSIMGLNLGEKGQFELAFRYQDLAHDLCAKYPNTFGATRGMNGIVWCNMHSRSHPADIVEYAHKAIQCGKNCGDLYNAGLSYGPLMWNLAIQGKNLNHVAEAAEECLQFSKKNQLSFSVGLAEAVLSGWVQAMKPNYQAIDMERTLDRWAKDNYVAASGSYFALLGFAQYFLGDYRAAAQSLSNVERYLHGMTDNVLKRMWYVFKILSQLRLKNNQAGAVLEKDVNPLLDQLKIWAQLGPLLRPYLAFIDAEIALFNHEFREARHLYLDAIAVAQTHRYDLLTGHLYQSLGELMSRRDPEDAALYFGEACVYYRRCRAESKINQLPTQYQFTNPETESHYQPEEKSHSTLPSLDISYLMKSAMALSAEIDLTQLMQKIMAVVLESSGAQHGYLLIRQDDELMVSVEQHIGKKHGVPAPTRPLHNVKSICRAIINYVQRTHQKVVLHNAINEGPFQNAPEIQAMHSRSVLCLPIIKQTELTGLLYLENRLTEGVFTPEKINMTELLTAQAAISLENARLLEETRIAYLQLKENQDHMLQMEKLSALGTLVGGVAHEINNPLMGVMNFVEFVIDRSDDAKNKTILNQAMQQLQRIKQIVSNMLVFLHTKSRPTGSCSVNEVLGQTLLLLEGEFHKTAITVSTELPKDLPDIACTAENLQQVLVNLLVNARDALSDTPHPRVDIVCSHSDHTVNLSITDNGPGISEEIQSRMFDPFFTTKPPGKGTGLGLSVTRRLIHDSGGAIKVKSKIGQGCRISLSFPENR